MSAFEHLSRMTDWQITVGGLLLGAAILTYAGPWLTVWLVTEVRDYRHFRRAIRNPAPMPDRMLDPNDRRRLRDMMRSRVEMAFLSDETLDKMIDQIRSLGR